MDAVLLSISDLCPETVVFKVPIDVVCPEIVVFNQSTN
jgi:hypothetical protein